MKRKTLMLTVPVVAQEYDPLNNQLPAQGQFERVVELLGYEVTVRGSVVDGIPRIATMFIP